MHCHFRAGEAILSRLMGHEFHWFFLLYYLLLLRCYQGRAWEGSQTGAKLQTLSKKEKPKCNPECEADFVIFIFPPPFFFSFAGGEV